MIRAALLAVFLAGSASYGMTLSVQAVDKGWLPVPGTKVKVVQVESCTSKSSSSNPTTVTTNENGWAEFTVEAPASYRILIERQGGSRATEKCIKLYDVPTQSRAYVQMQVQTEKEVPLHSP